MQRSSQLEGVLSCVGGLQSLCQSIVGQLYLRSDALFEVPLSMLYCMQAHAATPSP